MNRTCPICGDKTKDIGFRYCETHFRAWRKSPEFKAKDTSRLRVPMGQAHEMFEARERSRKP